jgi:hypothetical protein
MPKLKRGSNAKKIPHWRGTCPKCKRKRVKVLWTNIIEGVATGVCKRCGK